MVVIGLDLLFVTTDNAGGHIAHLGGALGGLLFAYMLNRGTDLTRYINNVIDFCYQPSLFRSQPRKPKMKVNYGRETGKEAEAKAKKSSDTEQQQQKTQENKSQQVDKQARINIIREKIKQSGYQGLTEEEKKELFNASIR